jgi:5,10-methylenetetrahydromethanopterin reductase
MVEAQRGVDGEPAGPWLERTGLALREPMPWHDLVQAVRTAEQTSYHACFVPEISGREAFSTLAGLAMATESILLGTGVVPVTARRLETTAMAAATVQDISGGRLLLGLGAGSPMPGAVDRLRRHVVDLRRALAGEEVEGHGGTFALTLPTERPPPIWIAALGDRMVALAGEVADGVLLNWCTPERVRRARRLIEQSAVRAGRDPAAVTVAVYVRACLGNDEGVALEALRAATAQYAAMPHYRRQLEGLGLGEQAARAAAAAQTGKLGDVPEELVRELCLVGRATAAAARLQEYRRAGADLPVAYPVPALDPASSVLGTILALAPSPALEG